MIFKEDILSATRNGLSVFKHYIPFEFRLGKNFKNPFYKDTRASCNIYYDRHNQCFKIKDFGNPDFSGDCFSFVAQIKGLNVQRDFLNVLQIINRDLNLNLHKTPMKKSNHEGKRLNEKLSLKDVQSPTIERFLNPLSPKEATAEYSFSERVFPTHELTFWKKYGINEKTLLRFEVKSLSIFRSINKEGNPYELKSSESEPMYGYGGDKYIKLYRPKSKTRFLYGGHIPDNYCFGLKQLPNRGDMLFITGGEKDVMSLYSKGFHAICFNSETSHIPTDIIEMLRYRFKHLILLYDMDKTGLDASLRHCTTLSQYEIERLLLPLSGTKVEKDISDYFMSGHSREDLLQLLIDLLKTKYTQTMALIKSCEVDFSNPPEFSENIISINGVPLGTPGNLLCITGGEGTGKSNYAAAIAAGTAIENDTHADTLGLEVQRNVLGKAVLIYDTEQSESQLYKNIRLLLKRANRDEKPEWLKAYYLTAMTRRERLRSIQDSMDYYYHYFGGIQLVIIDGIADLIRSANDETESIAIVEELYRLAGIYKTCVVCVLHFVPNSFKLRGHLGSELQRKASAILSIEKDTRKPEVSVIKALKVREGSPLDVPLMQFSWDKTKGLHVYLGEKPLNERVKRKEDDLMRLAKEIFSKHDSLSYGDLSTEIELAMDLKERAAKDYIQFMREKGIIKKGENNKYVIGKQ